MHCVYGVCVCVCVCCGRVCYNVWGVLLKDRERESERERERARESEREREREREHTTYYIRFFFGRLKCSQPF